MLISAQVPVNVLKFDFYAFDPQVCFEPGINYDKSGNFAGTRSPAADAEECQSKCQKHAQCKFWTLYSDGYCYLKDNSGTEKSESGVTSGPRVCPWNVTALGPGNVQNLLTR